MKKSAKPKSTPKKDLFALERANQVTSISRITAAVLFIALPFFGFWLGFNYQNEITEMYSACMSSTVAFLGK